MDVQKKSVCTPVALKLFQKTLEKLFDYDWIGLNLYYCKAEVRKGKLLNCKTREDGLLYIIAQYVHREFFYSGIYSPYFTIG